MKKEKERADRLALEKEEEAVAAAALAEKKKKEDEEEKEKEKEASPGPKKSSTEPSTKEASKEEGNNSQTSSWNLSYDGRDISVEVNSETDLETVRKNLAERMNTSAEQVVFFGDGDEGEVGEEGKVEIRGIEGLRKSYERGELRVGVKEKNGDDITFASVAMKMRGVDEAIKKFSDKVTKESERWEREEEEERKVREEKEMKERIEKSLGEKRVEEEVVERWEKGHVKQWTFNLTKDEEVAEKFETRGVTGKMLLDEVWVEKKMWNEIGGGGLSNDVKRRVEGYVKAMKVKGKGEDKVEEEIKMELVREEMEEKLRKEKEEKEKEEEEESSEEEEEEEEEEEDEDGKKKKEAEEKSKKLGKGGCCTAS